MAQPALPELERTSREQEQQPHPHASPRRRNRGPSPYFYEQQRLQNTLRCDYVLLWYERDPESSAGQCPNFLVVGDPIPVSLSHHVFMQMAFGVLKDRLVRASTQIKSVKEKKDSERGKTVLVSSQREAEAQTSTTPDTTVSKTKKTLPLREQDVVALFCFLWKYVSSMLQSQAEALNAFQRRNKSAPPPRPAVRMTKQQLRLQMVLEYNVDVRQFLGDGLSTSAAVSEAYCRKLMTGKVMEDEFLNQLAKPAGMAQTCSMV
ncbi:hypothetical protein TraAM80_04048 [Trypanosoma rangeli]|uniref:Uncharacterized protein n=1 Tax=Trypanosoma rangeli TaxID=5698 RepID=A0A422NL91_TRYRA|nr:uncharacterized protein TraAM80_04048 [Trypanosoma rangeli]RNF06225.1 hypothetical protein TraAM80_04048 [Trypanosoma rangeli]|eukprot:RNF06225.1 hypothetical protein TraAM80_04048 [Trypanosoma rangeli]